MRPCSRAMLQSINSLSYQHHIDMDTVTLSPKYQVVIPQSVRQLLGLSPGEKLHVLSYAGRVELVPARKMKSLRGFLKGMDTTIEREPDRT
jgi:AbrB family looped-hinge helix DNA binding protein